MMGTEKGTGTFISAICPNPPLSLAGPAVAASLVIPIGGKGVRIRVLTPFLFNHPLEGWDSKSPNEKRRQNPGSSEKGGSEKGDIVLFR